MFKRFVTVFLAFAFSASAFACADQSPTFKGPLSASEQRFVKSIQTDLMRRFATTADAQRAGYFRYTNADDTGAISYANLQWTSRDIRHPSQLWYDKNGNLLGADFSVPYSGNPRPQLWGINPGRWYELDDHVHWVQRGPNGTLLFDKYATAGRFRAAGGDPAHPSAGALVKMGRVSSASAVARIFDMPSIWDLIVWVKPNPKGAFAYKNPAVTP